MPDLPRTLVEFVDTGPVNLAHKMREIHINGVPVLAEQDSLYVEFGDGEPTKVTLTLLPTEIRFNHSPKKEP